MSELNKTLASSHITIGLGQQSALRHTLEDFAYLLGQAHRNPSHIAEIVGTDAPHVYGLKAARNEELNWRNTIMGFRVSGVANPTILALG
jgi:hypothetical protein